MPFVPVVPIRMTEAWLLIDEQAIRTASNNPNGIKTLDIPRINRLEHLPDHKNVLFEKIKMASELPSGRLRKFKPDLCET